MKEEKKLDKIRKEASANDETSTSNREELKVVNCLLGLTDVTGKGITIVLDDNKDIDSRATGKASS